MKEVNNQHIINEANRIRNRICKHFDIPKVPIKYSKRIKRINGLYYYMGSSVYGTHIKLGTHLFKDPVYLFDILLHELAHHLHFSEKKKQNPNWDNDKVLWECFTSKVTHGEKFQEHLDRIKEFYINDVIDIGKYEMSGA